MRRSEIVYQMTSIENEISPERIRKGVIIISFQYRHQSCLDRKEKTREVRLTSFFFFKMCMDIFFWRCVLANVYMCVCARSSWDFLRNEEEKKTRKRKKQRHTRRVRRFFFLRRERRKKTLLGVVARRSTCFRSSLFPTAWWHIVSIFFFSSLLPWEKAHKELWRWWFCWTDAL